MCGFFVFKMIKANINSCLIAAQVLATVSSQKASLKTLPSHIMVRGQPKKGQEAA